MAQSKQNRLLSGEELATFCSQMAMMLRSGISITESLGIMYDDARTETARMIMGALNEILHRGGSFRSALEETGRFPAYMLNMVEIGESTGNLERIMQELGDYYEREEAITRTLKSAVTYPLIMIVMMIAVIGVLLIKVLPIFNEVFLDIGGEMTGFSRTAMELGQKISDYSTYILLGVAGILLVFLLFRSSSRGSSMLESMKKRLLGGRKLQQKIASGRFASCMAMMLSSGLDTDQALALAEKLIDDKRTREKIANCRAACGSGITFSKALTESGLFSPVYAQMVAVAFKTGSVDICLSKLAQNYEQEVDARIDSLISVVEPTLIAILSIIVGLILLSVMLPLMSVMSSIG